MESIGTLRWWTMVEVVENVDIYRRIVANVVSRNTHISVGQWIVIFYFTRDVIRRRPALLWPLLTSWWYITTDPTPPTSVS